MTTKRKPHKKYPDTWIDNVKLAVFERFRPMYEERLFQYIVQNWKDDIDKEVFRSIIRQEVIHKFQKENL